MIKQKVSEQISKNLIIHKHSTKSNQIEKAQMHFIKLQLERQFLWEVSIVQCKKFQVLIAQEFKTFNGQLKA